MNTNELYERLNMVFCDVFDDDSIKVGAATVAADIDGWDSLMHITLIQAVEDEFSIRLAMKDVVSLKCVGDLAETVLARTSK